MTTLAMPGKPGTNRHPVDELADVRAQIKALQDREADLKQTIFAMMGGTASLGDDQYIAFKRHSERKSGIDEGLMKAAMIAVDQYRKPPVPVVTLVVEPRIAEAG